MKLIGTYLSPFARRVAAALVSRGIAYEHEDLNANADRARARIVNPVGKVPVLVLDDGEHLIDSAAILDYLDERIGPDHVLMPQAGAARRTALRICAIAMTLCERSNARYFEERRPAGTALPDHIERYRRQTIDGLQALDAAARDGLIGATPLSAATISAVVAFDFAALTHPDLDLRLVAPALAGAVTMLADEPAFATTRPRL